MRSSRCPHVQDKRRRGELERSKRGTGGTGEAEKGLIRGTTEEMRCTAEVHKMNIKCIAEVRQRRYTELRMHDPKN